MKKFVSLLLLVSLLITSSVSTVSAATPKESTVKKAYVSYLQKAIKNAEYGDDILYSLFDFNKDGVRELVVSFQDGARATYDVYTYYKGKVVSLGKNIGSIGYIENKKYLKLKNKVLKKINNLKRNFNDRDYYVYKKCRKCKSILKLPLPSKRGIQTVKCPKCRNRFKFICIRKKKIEVIKNRKNK